MKSPLLSLLSAVVATAAFAAEPPVDPIIAVRAPVVALTHARVIDGRNHAVLENQTLILRDGKIATLGADAEVKIPDGATVRDLTGKSVLPGLVMVH
jgi:enamidase